MYGIIRQQRQLLRSKPRDTALLRTPDGVVDVGGPNAREEEQAQVGPEVDGHREDEEQVGEGLRGKGRGGG